MTKQIIVPGFAAEGPTDVRFLESIIQRSFEAVAFECRGQIEVLPVQSIKKSNGDFIEVVKTYAKNARERGIMALCIHVDADDETDVVAFNNKINPAFAAVNDIGDESVCKNLVAIVPVQMSEAWLLADKRTLKEEIDTSKNDEELGIDRVPEAYADPKQTIETAIQIARQDLTRRRRRRLSIGDLYAPLGQKIALSSLEKLPSYRKFKEAVRNAFKQLNYLF